MVFYIDHVYVCTALAILLPFPCEFGCLINFFLHRKFEITRGSASMSSVKKQIVLHLDKGELSHDRVQGYVLPVTFSCRVHLNFNLLYGSHRYYLYETSPTKQILIKLILYVRKGYHKDFRLEIF